MFTCFQYNSIMICNTLLSLISSRSTPSHAYTFAIYQFRAFEILGFYSEHPFSEVVRGLIHT